jgi:predicted deacylase
MPRQTVDLEIAGATVAPGTVRSLELPIARLPSGTWASLPLVALRGRQTGPVVWVSSTVHGDELDGIEIIRRALRQIDPARLRGTVLAVPVVNVFGFLAESRYLPDRRDLNRSFPGSPRGSLAARLAHLFMSEIVERCEVGIDLHTGSGGRVNVPQVRADLEDERTRELARAFGPEVIVHARTRDGSLRAAATRAGKRVLLYEGGEASRFDQHAIDVGVRGVLRTLGALGMLRRAVPKGRPPQSADTRWIRARRSGLVRHSVMLGSAVESGQVIARIGDPLNAGETLVRATIGGMVIGQTRVPLVHQGDAVTHIARIDASVT